MANSNFRTLTLDKLDGVASTRNYIKNGSALQNVKGWTTYADTAGTSPVDGTGGSPTVTWTRTTSSPLSLDASFLFTKDAANRQGEGSSYDFTIDRADQAKVCRIDFDYEVASGTYADGDLTVWLYDVTNAQLIQPSASSILNAVGSQKKQPLSFQTNSNSTSYRLIIHVASTSASAYTVKFDSVSVTRESIAYGNYAGYLGQLTTTGAWTTNTTYVGKYWRTAEGNLKAEVTVSLTGAPNALSLYLNLPNSLSIDADRMSTTNSSSIVGYGKDLDTGSTVYRVTCKYSSATAIDVLVSADTGSGYQQDSNSFVSNIVPQTFANGDYITVRYEVPILGWNTPLQLSSDAETRVVAGWVGGSSTTITSGAGATTVVYNTVVEDTHGDTYNTSTGAWTCKIPGWYQFDYKITDGSITPAAADRSIQISLSVDGAGEYGIATHPTLNTQLRGVTLGGSFKFKLRAGQVVRVRAESSLGDTYSVLNNTGYSYLQWCMIQGPAQIAASEAVVFSGRNAAGTGFVGVTTIPFATVDVDTHGGYSAGIYTVKTPGMYEITSTVMLESQSWTAGSEFVYRIMVDGSTVRIAEWIAPRTATQYSSSVTISAIIKLNVGQAINFAANQTESGAARNLIASSAYNMASIKRIG